MCTGTDSFGGGTSGTSSEKIIAASSLLPVFGNLQQGKQGKAFYDYRSDQALADAAAERGAGIVRAGKIRKAGNLAQGEVRAAYGGSGIDVNSGTALVTAEQLQRNISEDATAQLLTGERRARALNAQAAGDRMAGENARSAGYLGATRSLLTGAAAALNARQETDKWQRMRTAEFKRTRTADYVAAGGGISD